MHIVLAYLCKKKYACIFVEISARRRKLLAVVSMYLKFKICKDNTVFHLWIYKYQVKNMHGTKTE